ncbi:SAV_2336 N-terminal domain-related protein [Streptomyces monomycini]|uniref:SAV_2336 N-terminal domain-related protein n=1 Tax=Streptomyces monomycini TaxID=371720 RepID=UPI001EE9ED39|nr:SAV_2336 N-terminal domain-related protein [Streptomyces monomycini]
MIDRLRQILAGQGYDLGAGELLDVLWLARAVREGELRSTLPGPEAARDTGPGEPEDAPADSAAADAPEDGSGGGPEETDGPDRTDGPCEDGAAGGLRGGVPATVLPSQRSLYAMGSEGGSALSRRARPARAPGRRALARPQHLSRALRPLRRFEPHPHRCVTDVEATVRLAAETALFDVVSRPDQEHRWSAVLLVDDAPSMQVWTQLAGELRSVLDRGGIFRSVRVCAFDPRDMAVLGRLPWTTGSTLTFVLTDGTSPGWRTPDAARAVRRWGRYGPVAVLHPLPRRLWRGTALDAQPRLLTSPVEFAGPDRTRVLDPLTGEPDPEAEEPGTVALPVVPLTPGGLGQWAALLTRPGVPHLIDTVLLGEEPEQDPPRPAGSAAELVAHFRGAFSPESYRLAVRLSAINPLTVPLMQLVRAATMSDAGPTQVAEILLGGLLERVAAPRGARSLGGFDGPLGTGSGQPVYDFRPGVRELLFSGLGTQQSLAVVEAVGRALEPYMGRLPDFPALVADDTGEMRLQESAQAFAVLASPVLERLGGRVPGAVDVSGGGVGADGVGGIGDPGVADGTGGSGGPSGSDGAVGTEEPAGADDGVPGASAAPSAVDAAAEAAGTAAPAEAPTESAGVGTVGELVEEPVEESSVEPVGRPVGRPVVTEPYAPDGPAAEPAPYPPDARPAPVLPAEELREPLRFTVLGPVGLWRGDQRIDVPSRLDRALLAALLLRHEGVASEAELLNALWGGNPPRNARAVLDHSIARLRKALGEDEHVLVRERVGYALRADAGTDIDMDLERAEGYERAARAARDAGEWDRARTLLTAALALWRGEPLAGLPGPYAQTERLRLTEWRHTLAEDRIECDLWLGRYDEAVSELSELFARSPSRPRLGELLALARDQVRTGRGDPALRPPREPLRITVLGPVRMLRGGVDLATGSPQQRALLAVLVLRAGRVISEDDLIDALWADDPPNAAHATLRTYATRLRKALGPDAEVLVGEDGGYALRRTARTDLDVDLRRADDLVAVARDARAAQDWDSARDLLDAAIALWRGGQPLAGLPGPYLRAESRRLADRRRTLVEDRTELELRLGRHAAAEEALTWLLYLDPARERTRELLARALAHDEQVSPGLRSLLRAGRYGPRQDRTGGGRTVELGRLADHLTRQRPTVRNVGVISGGAGVGKTSLAARVADAVQDRFPDGRLYAIMPADGDPEAAVPHLAAVLLRQLGYRHEEIPADAEERMAFYRSAIDALRLVVVLDEVRAIGPLLPLLPDVTGAALLVGRDRPPAGLTGVLSVHLESLSTTDALEVLALRVGEERVAARRAVARAALEACGCSEAAVEAVAAELMLDGPADRTAADIMINNTALRLTHDLDPPALATFRLLALPHGPDLPTAAVAALTGTEPAAAQAHLETLARTGLLKTPAPGRYRHREALASFAYEELTRHTAPEHRDAALSRLLDWYLATAHRAYGLDAPGALLLDRTVPPAEPVPALPLADRGAASDWWAANGSGALAVVRQTADLRSGAYVARCADTLLLLEPLLGTGLFTGRYEQAAVAVIARVVAGRDQKRAEARARLARARACLAADRFADAEDEARRAYRLGLDTGDPVTSGRAPLVRGVTAVALHRPDAEQHFMLARSHCQVQGDRLGEAAVLVERSRLCVRDREAERGVGLARQGVDIYRAAGQGLRLGTGLYFLAVAQAEAGRHEEALAALEEALPLLQEAGQRLWTGLAQLRTAESCLATNSADGAVRAAEEAVRLFAVADGGRRAADGLSLLAHALEAQGQASRAQERWSEALTLYETLDVPGSGGPRLRPPLEPGGA